MSTLSLVNPLSLITVLNISNLHSGKLDHMHLYDSIFITLLCMIHFLEWQKLCCVNYRFVCSYV